HATWCGFWGEVYSDRADWTNTTTNMGSGLRAKYGWPWSAYQRNLLIQTTKTAYTAAEGTLAMSAEDSNMYDIQRGGSGFKKFFFFGGSGAGTPHIVVYPGP